MNCVFGPSRKRCVLLVIQMRLIETLRITAPSVAKVFSSLKHERVKSWAWFHDTQNQQGSFSYHCVRTYSFTTCFGTCQFLHGLWMDLSAACVAVLMRTDASSLVTTATATRLPEQKETIRMITMLRQEPCSRQSEDLAHA